MEREIVGYDLTETKEVLEEKQKKLKMIMKDIQWRSNNSTLRTKEEFEKNDIIQSLKVQQYDSKQMIQPIEFQQKHNQFNKDNNLSEYFKGNTSIVYVDQIESVSNDVNDEQNIMNQLQTNIANNLTNILQPLNSNISNNQNILNNNDNDKQNNSETIITQNIIDNKPSPSQITHLYNSIQKPFDINQINKSSVSNEYWNVLNENISTTKTNKNYILSNQNKLPCENVSQLPIFANINKSKENTVSNNPFVHSHKQNSFIPQLPIDNLIDWIVDCSEDEFIHRRYQFLCSIDSLTINDPLSFVISSLNKQYLTRRCILFSDLAEMKLLDLPTLFSKLSIMQNENIPILIKNIFTTNQYVTAHQDYLMKTIVEMKMNEDENGSDEEGKKKGKKKTTKKKGKKKSKAKIEKDRQEEREKRLKVFGIIEGEEKDVELANEYRRNQKKACDFIVNLFRSNNSSINNYIQKTALKQIVEQPLETESINLNTSENVNNTNQQMNSKEENKEMKMEEENEQSHESELSENHQNNSNEESENNSQESEEDQNPILQLINELMKSNDWYHFVLVAIELLHPAIIKKSIVETEAIIDKLIQSISVVYYHPKIMNLINCCYSLTKSQLPHITMEIKGKTMLFLTMLLDYIEQPTGNLLKIQNQIETQMKHISELRGERILNLTQFNEKEYEIKMNGINDETMKLKYIIGTLINLIYDKNKEHFNTFFTFIQKEYPLYPIPYLLCKYMHSHLHISSLIQSKCIELIKENIISTGTFIKQFIQPSIKQSLKSNDKERIFMYCQIISELMTMKNINNENIWNIRLSEMIIEEIILSLNILDQERVNHLFINSFGGNIDEFITIHKEKVFKLLKGKEKEKIISGLFWKPNTLYNHGEIKLNYIEEHQCSLSSISLVFSIITIERGIDLFLYILLSQNYSLPEMKVLIEEMNSEIFKSELFTTKIIDMLNHLEKEYSNNPQENIDTYIIEELSKWHNQLNTDDNNEISCNQCVVNAFLYVLKVLFQYNQSVELISPFVEFISLPPFTKYDTQTITTLVTSICEYRNKQMETEELTSTENETIETKQLNEIKRHELLINGMIQYLMKFNHNTETVDIYLIDNILETLTVLFEFVLQYSEGKQIVVSFDEELKKRECDLSFLNYIYSQLPFIEQIISEKNENDLNDDDFEIEYYPKQQLTYANLLHEPKVTEFIPQV